MTNSADQPALRTALAALEQDASMPPTLIDDALTRARARAIPRAPDGATHRRMAVARWAMIAAAVALIAALATALAVIHTDSGNKRSSASTAAKPAVWLTYVQDGFSVRHPAAWRAYPLHEEGSFSSGIVSLSTERVPAACRTSTGATGNVTGIACDPPTAPLTDGGVLVTWTISGLPGLGGPSLVDRAAGTTTRIDDRAAKIAISTADDTCVRSHANRTITITIGINHNSTLDMHACIAATGDQLTALTKAVIASARTVQYARAPNPPSNSRAQPATAPLSLRLRLADPSVPADGTPIHGYVLATNHTGHPLEIRDAHCDAWVQAGLSGPYVHFAVSSLDVACGSSQLREGVTRIPVIIATTYGGCQQGKQPGTPDTPHCTGPHDSTIPPLPPGTYHVEVGTQHVSPTPVLPRPMLVRLLPTGARSR
jgi:hypothetical protein